MTIHILTSWKGGTGKSVSALSIANHYINSGRNVVLIDTNPQNSNISEDIFFYFHAEGTTIDNNIHANGTVYTISPESNVTFTVFDATDQNPFEVARRIQLNDDSDAIYIIDTNVHIRSCSKNQFSLNGNHKVYVWFIWGWSSPRLTHQLDAILDATNYIEESWPKTEVIHVFNLYDFFIGGISLSIRKTNVTLKPLKKVLREIDKRIKRFVKGKCEPVYVDDMIIKELTTSLHSTLVRYIAPDDISMSDLPGLWADSLMELLHDADKMLPYNILLIPTFFRELTLSIDRILMSSPRSLETVTNQIRPIVDFIDVFLTVLDKCSTSIKMSDLPRQAKLIK